MLAEGTINPVFPGREFDQEVLENPWYTFA